MAALRADVRGQGDKTKELAEAGHAAAQQIFLETVYRSKSWFRAIAPPPAPVCRADMGPVRSALAMAPALNVGPGASGRSGVSPLSRLASRSGHCLRRRRVSMVLAASSVPSSIVPHSDNVGTLVTLEALAANPSATGSLITPF